MWSLVEHIFFSFFCPNLWCIHQIFGQQLSSNHIECVHFFCKFMQKQYPINWLIFFSHVPLLFFVDHIICFAKICDSSIRFFDYMDWQLSSNYGECVQIFASWCKNLTLSTNFLILFLYIFSLFCLIFSYVFLFFLIFSYLEKVWEKIRQNKKK